ncbi:hypothetical protein CLOM621_08114 [Clostridium sp. M62/1]|nr:hypothetical protein CLOM621_08114 [Clostridium sp. M62/1]
MAGRQNKQQKRTGPEELSLSAVPFLFASVALQKRAFTLCHARCSEAVCAVSETAYLPAICLS